MARAMAGKRGVFSRAEETARIPTEPPASNNHISVVLTSCLGRERAAATASEADTVVRLSRARAGLFVKRETANVRDAIVFRMSNKGVMA